MNDENLINDIVITLDGEDRRIPMNSLGISMQSSDRDVLDAVNPLIQDTSDVNLRDSYGEYSFAVRRATNSGTIYVYPKPVAGSDLPEMSDEKRLSLYKMLTSACTHLFSKGKLQEDKFKVAANLFAELATKDPVFMAHFAAWAMKQDSKDLKALSIYFNFLNAGDGTPFFPGSKLNKPNYRAVSSSLLQEVDPHLALRILEFATKKFEVTGTLNMAYHCPNSLITAYRKYIRYRESKSGMLKGIRKNGLSGKMQNIYRKTGTVPTDEAAIILGWKQKGKDLQLNKLPDFTNSSSEEIANTLGKTKISPMVALSIIPNEKIDAGIAKQLLKNCTGNQSIILFRWFSNNGFLDIPEISALFKTKMASATTAIDRIDTLTKEASAEDKAEFANVRSAKRKEVAKTSSLGKIFFHIDVSSSMNQAIDFAKEKASIFAECVSDPQNNFAWGTFNAKGRVLKNPINFTKEGFYQALFGVTASGYTDCIALYEDARKVGANVDVYVTDQGHNVGVISKRIVEFHEKNPHIAKPTSAVIVDFSENRSARVKNSLQTELEKVGIPVAIIAPDALKESALVAQSISNAMKGELCVIEEIMNTTLPQLPSWWNSVSSKAKVKDLV